MAASSKQSVCSACGFANPPTFRFCGSCGASLESSAHSEQERSQAERRQLTVLFCDLVGSSLLASRLDPEELRDLILSYQTACTSIIQRYDGTVSRYVGDGILALFGYPRAHEDDAERAVLSGLDIIAAMKTLPALNGLDGAESLTVRVGIATGLVVVGDLIGEGAAEEQAVMGETPNLAARLQGLATPNSVVIAAGTRALLGERFNCTDLGVYSLHGFPEPVRAWRALAPRFVASRFEAAQSRGVTPLINRTEYMAWLRQLWQEAVQSRGRVGLLLGEAGIGKSRVVEAIREEIEGTPYTALRYQCSPHYVNSALHPVIEHIERAAGIGREDTPEVKLSSLSAWLNTHSPNAAEAVPLLAALLSIPTNQQFALPAMSPQRQKERTFELLLQYMERMASAWPLPIIFEDVHWIDPTTQEFLTQLIERVREMRALLLLTYRSDFSPPWRDQPHVEHRELTKLAPEYAMGLAECVAGDRLPQLVIEEAVAKTDGVPLFIEELTKAVAEAEASDPQQNGPSAHTAFTRPVIPSTLHDSLMARLDQLGSAKFIAQVAGAIGREFSYELLEAVALLPAERLRDGLQVLEQSGLVHAEPRRPVESYAFKHALVQEAAYQSLLRSRRRELHQRIAEALESRFPQTARDAPELLAHHWTEAGVAQQAVASWLAAGQRASERSEYREAIGHLRRGLDLISRLSDPDEQRSRELALLLALGPALIVAEGAGTPEVGRLYTRALELCAALPECAPHFVAHWGWWRVSMDHRMGRTRADKLVALANNLGDQALRVQAHHSQWATLYMLGAHQECCRQVEAGLKLYDPNHHHGHAALYGGHDARVCGLGERALAGWFLGYAEDALIHVQSALTWAQELRHVGSQAHAMDYVVVLHKFRRDVGAVHECADKLVSYAAEQKLRVHRAKGAFFRGWAHAQRQDVGEGLSEMLAAIASEKTTDTPGDFTVYYEMLAETYGRAGRYDEGLRAVEEAFTQAARCGIVFWNAELHRRRGELLLRSGEPRAAAFACFEEALACARAQDALALELRAAVSLAQWYRGEGERQMPQALLRPVLERFREGFDTPDVIEARQLLEALR